MNSRPLRPERSALPSALYPVEKRQRTLPYGCGRRIRTLTMRVRVAGATITQFRIKLLYYYTKNRACCQYPFERNFTRAKEILHREGLWQKSFAAFRAGRGIPSGARHSGQGAAFRAGRGIPGRARHSERGAAFRAGRGIPSGARHSGRGAAFRAGRGIPSGARHSERGAAFRAGRGIPGRARHLREEPLLHWTHSPLQNGGYSSLPKGDTAPCKMGGIAPCRRGHTAPCKMGGYSSLPKGTHSPLATLGTRLAKETEDVL